MRSRETIREHLMILPTDSLDTFCSFGSLSVDNVTGTTWKMYNFRIRHSVLGWSHKRKWKDTMTLGMRIPLPQHLASWALPMRCGNLWMEKRKLGAHRPPPNSRGDSSLCTGAQHALRDSPLTCSHTLGTEQITANDMVPAQWEHLLNSRQACHSKAVRSTYNFLPPFQGQKVDIRKLLFTKYCAFLWGTKRLLWISPMSLSQEVWVWGWPSPLTSWQWLWANS